MNKVTVITPTTHDRQHFNERCLSLFAAQDYQNIEHLFDYGTDSIGAKLNRICERATGSIIVRMDSDDIYAPDWVTRSVQALQACELTGLSTFNFHNYTTGEIWQYRYPDNENMAGATLCFTKEFWQRGKFKDMSEGEDSEFIRGHKFKPHDYVDGFIATIHAGNTSKKNTTGERWVRV